MPQNEMTTTALEAYVIAEDDAAKAAILANQPQGCEAWYELELSERFRLGKALDKETEALLSSFENIFPQAAEQWRLRWLVTRAGKLGDGSEEQKQAIKDLMPHLGIHLNSGYAAAGTSSTRGPGDPEVAVPSSLPADAVPTKERILEQFQTGNRDVIRRIPPRLLADVDFGKMGKDEDFLFFVRMRSQVVPVVASNATFMKRVITLMTNSKKPSNSLQELLKVLSLEQIEEMGQAITDLLAEPDYVQAVMLRRFPDAFDPEAANLFSLEERRVKLMELANFLLGLRGSGPGHTLQVLLSQILLEVLQLHVQMNKLDKKMLLLYLEEVRKAALANAAPRPPVPQRIDRVALPLICSSLEALGVKRSVMEQPPVREHLRAFILEDDFWPVATSLLPVDEAVLKRFRDEVTLCAGRQLKSPNADPEWVQTLSDRSSLELLPHNKEQFAPDEAVKLAVRLKNVPRLMVRIYEINAEAYYVHHQKPFVSDISLDGIGATLELEHEYNQAPIVEHDEEITFEQLIGKQGLFVLDLIGADLRSRAVVRKGTLSLIHRETPVGHVAYVLAPDRSVVQSGARLCLEGRWYESDPAKRGRIIVPYGKTQSRLKVIISALGMAQFSEFQRLSEQYEMMAAHVLANESVVMGQKARLLIQPRLLCCGRTCDLKLIKKAEVTVSMQSGSENVPTVRTFTDFSWEAGNIEVEFLVPPKLKTIEANLQVEVFNHSKQEIEKLGSARRWRVDDLSRGVSCYELFLTRPKAGFEVRCLGKDGEPRAGMTIALTMTGLIASDTTLVTDALGIIRLGPLDGVDTLVATVAGVVRCWALPSSQKVIYPGELDMLEGEALELPLDEADSSCVTLVELVGQQANLLQPLAFRTTTNVTVVPPRSSVGLSSLAIKGLQRGTYRLVIGERCIQIMVHRGQKWQDDYVLRHDAILEYTERPRVLAINSATAGPDGLTAEVQGGGPNTKVHIFGLRFLPSDLLDMISRLFDAEQERAGTTKFPFQMWKNIFSSNVKLGDEFGYVLRRRKASAQVGNMLKRPNLLLHPRAVQDTSFRDEVVSDRGNFAMQQECAAPPGMPMMMQQACMPAAHSRCCASMAAPPPPPGCAVNQACDLSPCPGGEIVQGSSSVDSDVIQGFQNFLKEESIVALNQSLDEDGKVHLQANFGDCTCVLVVASDKGSVTHRLVSVGPDPSVQMVSRGLTLAEPLAPGSFFMEKRTAKALKAGDSFAIADQASVEWRAIDSVERLVAFYQAVCPQHLAPVSSWNLATWGGLDAAAKAKIWSTNVCHEMHLFICMKDPTFFKDAVMPFMKSKMERDVVDWFLLGDDAMLEKYLAAPLFQALNPLEQVLILRRLAGKTEFRAACQKLVQALQAKAKALVSKRVSATQRNALLDSVLSLEEVKKAEEWTVLDDEDEGAFDMDVDDSCCEEEEESRPPMGGIGACAPSLAGRAPSFRSAAPMGAIPKGGAKGGMGPGRRGGRGFSGKGMIAPSDAGMFGFGAAETAAVMMGRKMGWEEVEGTKEYRETQYLVLEDRKGARPVSADFTLSEFWADAAAHALEASDSELLLSPHFVFATSSPHEVLAAIALSDLPLAAESHNLVSRGGLSASFDAASACIFVAKEIVAVPSPEAGSDLGVAVRVYKATLDETTSKDPRAMTEFVVGEPYCLQAIVTNVSPKELEAQVLIQIPEGAVPVAESLYTRAQTARLPAFACLRVTSCFYFPRPGQFTGAPVHCSVDGKAAAASTTVTYNVVMTPTTTEVQAFSDIVAAGEDAVIKFLLEADILGGEKGFSFRQIYGMLRSPTFYRKAITALRGRYIYDRFVWEYGFLHGDALACKEMLSATPDFHRRLGTFESALINVTAADAEDFHLEYHPLVNKRAHRLSESAPRILNEQLRRTYEELVLALARKCRPLDVADELRLSYYLLCQDRVQEAEVLYKRAAAKQSLLPAAGDLQLQLEYMAAYFDLFNASSDHTAVQRIAKAHSTCPHAQWRKRFEELATVLAEISGSQVAATGATAVEFEAAPALSATLHKGTMEIEATGLTEITAKLYNVELEMLFSRMPFIKAESLRSEFSFVKPVFEVSIPGKSTSWQIPEEFRNMDLAVELVASKTLHVFQMHYASGLRVAVAEQHGYLTVTNADGAPLPATYVKVFAKVSGSEKFFKDGYTDLRGRFDYASLSGDSASKVSRFAILVASSKLGGVVREAPPPKRSS